MRLTVPRLMRCCFTRSVSRIERSIVQLDMLGMVMGHLPRDRFSLPRGYDNNRKSVLHPGELAQPPDLGLPLGAALVGVRTGVRSADQRLDLGDRAGGGGEHGRGQVL